MIKTTYKSPNIGHSIKEIFNQIKNPEDFILALQLAYRENHTIYYMNRLESIQFHEGFLEIKHNDGGSSYYNYEDISEYHIINADDLNELWSQEI